MKHDSLHDKIIKHLNGLNKVEQQSDVDTLVSMLAVRYKTSDEVVKKAVAEWQAGLAR